MTAKVDNRWTNIMPQFNGKIKVQLNIGYDDQIYLSKVDK